MKNKRLLGEKRREVGWVWIVEVGKVRESKMKTKVTLRDIHVAD